MLSCRRGSFPFNSSQLADGGLTAFWSLSRSVKVIFITTNCQLFTVSVSFGLSVVSPPR